MSHEIDAQAIAKQLLTEISNDTTLCTPVYLGGITSEQEAEAMDQAPLVYLWNEDQDSGAFSLSVNTGLISERLATMIPRDHPQFDLIREGVTNAIKQTAQASVSKLCEQLGAFPSQVFKNDK